MSNLVQRLHNDHIHFARLLELLSAQLAGLKVNTHTDYPLILDAIDYVSHYPDTFHHPIEDRLFELYSQEKNDLNEVFSRLEEEHSMFKTLTKELYEDTESILNGQAVRREHYAEKLSNYINRLRQHMNLEESQVFPIFNKHFSESVLQNTSAGLSLPNDQLFHGELAGKYRNLYKKLGY